MYLEIPQGKQINIQGLNCWIPPEGYVYNNLTKQLEYTGIHKRSDIPKEQYWERTPLPKWYKEVTKKGDILNISVKKYLTINPAYRKCLCLYKKGWELPQRSHKIDFQTYVYLGFPGIQISARTHFYHLSI